MRKLTTVLLLIMATLISFSQGNYPVSPGYGGVKAAIYQQRVITDGGTYYPNSIPHELDFLHSYGIEPTMFYMPSATKASTTYSVYPIAGGSDFTVARTSGQTVVNSDGLLEEIAANIASIDYTFGTSTLVANEATTNEITYPLSFGNSYWTKSGASIEGDASTAGSSLNTDTFINSGNASFDYDTFSGATATGFTASTVSVNGGYVTFEPTANFSANNIYLLTYDLVVNSGTAPYVKEVVSDVNQLALLVAGTDNTIQITTTSSFDFLYISHDAGATADFVISNVSIQLLQGYPSPSTTYTDKGFKLVEDGTTGGHYVGNSGNLTVTAGSVTTSVYAKAGERNWIYLYDNTVASVKGWFDLTNGVAGTMQAGIDSYDITALANGWYRCSITFTSTGTANARIYMADADGSSSYTGTVGNGVKIAFAQLEELPYASAFTYSGTEGATSSRIADVINGAAYSGDSESGCLMVEMAAFADDLTNRIISLSDGGATVNAITIYYTSSTNKIRTTVFISSSQVYNYEYEVSDITNFNKVAVRWKAANFSLWINGTKVNEQLSGTTFGSSVINDLSFDRGGALPFYGYINQLITTTYPTDAEMVTLTTQ